VILADSSAWVEFDRASKSRVDERLTELIETEAELAVTEPIVMEVLSSARDGRREGELRRLLERFELLRFDAAADFDGAVRIYRSCRAAGVTPRGLIDCMVAAVAQRHRAIILTHDLDFARLAGVIALDLDEASLRS
jgi:predicted nucleic acid-binding protein